MTEFPEMVCRASIPLFFPQIAIKLRASQIFVVEFAMEFVFGDRLELLEPEDAGIVHQQVR